MSKACLYMESYSRDVLDPWPQRRCLILELVSNHSNPYELFALTGNAYECNVEAGRPKDGRSQPGCIIPRGILKRGRVCRYIRLERPTM